jgi:hypothetical protein
MLSRPASNIHHLTKSSVSPFHCDAHHKEALFTHFRLIAASAARRLSKEKKDRQYLSFQKFSIYRASS